MAFAYDGTHIYAHSKAGIKITMMRKNPFVCFPVDIIENMANWRSVIIQGEYEELKSGSRQAVAYSLLKDRLTPCLQATYKTHLTSFTMRKGIAADLFQDFDR